MGNFLIAANEENPSDSSENANVMGTYWKVIPKEKFKILFPIFFSSHLAQCGVSPSLFFYPKSESLKYMM